MGGYTAVKHIDLTASPGEFIAIVGPTGCGKSTLLNALVGQKISFQGTSDLDNECPDDSLWQPASGWHSYSGPSDHTDHVHVSML